VADAVESPWQVMEQEAADKLVSTKRHDLLPLGPIPTIIFVPEGDTVVIEADEAAVRKGDPVRVARQIGEYGLGAGERRFGIDDPTLFADW
jgi:hypothetical protein